MADTNTVAGLAVQTLTVVVNRGDKRLGLMLDDSNVVLEVKPNSPANGLILPGDQAAPPALASLPARPPRTLPPRCHRGRPPPARR